MDKKPEIMRTKIDWVLYGNRICLAKDDVVKALRAKLNGKCPMREIRKLVDRIEKYKYFEKDV